MGSWQSATFLARKNSPSNTDDIFTTNAVQCRVIVDALWRIASNKQRPLPNDILNLCIKYYLVTYCNFIEPKVSPKIAKLDNIFSLRSSKEYIFKHVNIKRSSITGNGHILKITVLKDLYLGTDCITSGNYPCKIICDRGKMILNVFGDIHIGRNCSIINHFIYIKCKNLFMSNGSRISTYNNNRDILFGNVYIKIENDLIVEDGCDITRGDIRIDAGGSAKIGIKNGNVKVIALRNKLTVNVGDSLLLHEKSYLYGKKGKLLNKLQDDKLSILSADDIHYSNPKSLQFKYYYYYPKPKGFGEIKGGMNVVPIHHYPTPKQSNFVHKLHRYPTPQIEGDI